MTVCDRLYHATSETAFEPTVDLISVGLGYTAVCTSDGGIVLSYTVLKAIRHGQGTPVLQRYSRKSYLVIRE